MDGAVGVQLEAPVHGEPGEEIVVVGDDEEAAAVLRARAAFSGTAVLG